jgi:hypothetical protein
MCLKSFTRRPALDDGRTEVPVARSSVVLAAESDEAGLGLEGGGSPFPPTAVSLDDVGTSQSSHPILEDGRNELLQRRPTRRYGAHETETTDSP